MDFLLSRKQQQPKKELKRRGRDRIKIMQISKVKGHKQIVLGAK